ncbi:hypothetical protein G4X40_19855 [Rhodococcus sp. D2-41]|uniref:hypothetical protein n=1 Tax=Speluncibacter jeojiensis TaxID=2710754 RepID=UPI00240EF9A2|nr:hypothetical protein [Rhodococcus sp. D2-41]MDG3012399.1 hypothetical protein [Rhodococcus sp. D2-41]
MTDQKANYGVSMAGNPELPVWIRPTGCECEVPRATKSTNVCAGTLPSDWCEHWEFIGYMEDADHPTADQLASGFAFPLSKFRDNLEED